MKFKKAYIISMTSLTLVVLVCGFISTPVSAQTYYLPRDMTPFYSTSTSGSGSGEAEIIVPAVAHSSSGYVYSDTNPHSSLFGVYQVDSIAGFRGVTFTAGYTGNILIGYWWQISWEVDLEAMGGFDNYAEATLKLGGNLYCVSSQTWAQNGDVQITLVDEHISRGYNYIDEEVNKHYFLAFNAYVVYGQTYELYTYMSTHAKASAGLGYSSAHINVGSGGMSACLDDAYVE